VVYGLDADINRHQEEEEEEEEVFLNQESNG
jgi:hypothetical protein